MNIIELIQSNNLIGYKRRPHYVFSSKPFGKIYAYNKTVVYKPHYSVIELSMFIGAKTQKDRTAHKISVAFKGIDMVEKSALDLLATLKLQNKFKDLTLDQLQEKVENEEDLLFDRFIVKANKPHTYIVMEKRIPLTTEIRVKCTCADYYYTYQWYNADAGVHIGNRGPGYIKRGSSNIRVRNPYKRPGVCKHMLLFSAMLMSQKLLVTSIGVLGNYNSNSRRFEVMNNTDIRQIQKDLKIEIN